MTDDAHNPLEPLMRRVRDGDEAALTELIQRYEPKIRRTVRSMLGPLLRPYLDSVDVAQSIQMAMLMGMRDDKLDLSDPDRLIGLATRMAQRKVADHWRRQSRRRRLLDEHLAEADLTTLLRGAAEDPADISARNEAVQSMLRAVDPEDRRLLELRLLGHSTADAANVMGVKSNVLRARLGRLRRQLRDHGLLDDWI